LRSGSQTSYLRKLFIQKSRALSHVANFLYSPSVVVIHIVVKICRIFVAIRLRVDNIMKLSFIYCLCTVCMCCVGYVDSQDYA